MRIVLIGFLILALCGSAAARTTLSPVLQRTLIHTVRQHNQQLKRGKAPMDLGLVFRLVGRTLERTNGDQAAAVRMARKAARWTAGRAGQRTGAPRPLSSNVVRALRTACQLHRTQVRKGTSVPYLSHLLGVAGIVMRTGGNDREIMAALLHDAVEDQGGARTMRLIRRRFGRGVAGIVGEATEPPGPWLARKQHKIDHIAGGNLSAGGLRVKLADCLHNSGTMTHGARREGAAFWRVFSGKKDGTLWYHAGMSAAFDRATAGANANANANAGGNASQLRALAQRYERQVVRLHRAADAK
jgi:HD domain